METEKHDIEKCLKQIEDKLGWGASTEWQNQDFEALSDRIFKETKVSLSASTLKRLWGKIRYEGSPNVATLNALAKFVGYENWRAFTANGFGRLLNGGSTRVTTPLIHSKILKGSLLIIAMGIGGILFWTMQKRPKQLEYDNIVFSSQPVTNTVPNTVIFKYDTKDSNADSVFIQQSWDPTRRHQVDKNLTEFTSTYYLPGYYQAKLILDSTIVAQHDLFIESNGWLATIEREPVPIYASEKQILNDGIVRIPDEFFSDQNIDLENEKQWTSFFHVAKNDTLSDKAFQMDVTLRNSFGKGSLVCQHTQIALLGTMGVIVIPLSIKGCVGELGLQADKYFDGKTNDLSAFGVDFSNWVTVQCRTENKKIFIRVNEALAFESDYQIGIGQVVGVRIRFMGTGEVKSFDLRRI